MGTASAQTTTACGPAPAGYNVIESNERFIIGTTGSDFICAGDGNNIIRAKGFDDIIYGGGGNDVIWGGFGNDMIFGGDGDDLIRAGGGLDNVWGEDGNDTVLAGTGPDNVRGGPGNDSLTGGDGHDTLRGEAGDDILVGNIGIDTLVGDAGRDSLQGGIGPDRLTGGSENDRLTGGDHDDVLLGGNGDDNLLGGNGEDSLTGGAGNDVLAGGGNPDILRGGAGNDIINGGNGLNQAQGGDGEDSCRNVDSPLTTCEIIDGIDLDEPQESILLNVPLAGNIIATGAEWTPSETIELYRPAQGSTAFVNETEVTTNAAGQWAQPFTAAQLNNRDLLVRDRNAGVIKSVSNVLNTANYVAATRTLTVNADLNQTVEAFVYDTRGTLIFVEQMSFLSAGAETVDFLEITGAIGQIEIRHSDAEGDTVITQIFAA